MEDVTLNVEVETSEIESNIDECDISSEGDSETDHTCDPPILSDDTSSLDECVNASGECLDNTCDADKWTLGCKSYCKDERAPNYSKVKEELIAYDANLSCQNNTWYHLFCEGFRRMPSVNNLSASYACKSCREVHPDRKELEINNGFYS